jgi:hypothetical protein
MKENRLHPGEKVYTCRHFYGDKLALCQGKGCGNFISDCQTCRATCPECHPLGIPAGSLEE